jgi:hypothetical protein
MKRKHKSILRSPGKARDGNSGQKKIFLQISGYLFLFLLFVIAIRFDDIKGTFNDSISYLTTRGTITSSSVRGSWTRGVYYHYDIRYEYYVAQKRYESNKITFSYTGAKDKKFAEEYITEYPIGKEVTVYYDSDNPSFSVLEPSIMDTHSFYLVASIFSACFIFFGFIWFLSHQGKADNHNET